MKVMLSRLAHGEVGGEHAPRPVDVDPSALFVTLSKDGKSHPVSLRDLIEDIKEEVYTSLLQKVPDFAKAIREEVHG